MTALTVIAFIAFLWIAHGFWCDYKEAHRPRTKEEIEQLLKEFRELELDLFHKRLYLNDLASPWEPKQPQTQKHAKYITYSLGQDNLIDLTLFPTINPMFISAELKTIYLQSEKWINLKQKRLVIAKHQCECCGSVNQLQCHHITYERLTMEHIDDLVILCGGSNGCHQKIHDILGTSRTTKYPISILKKHQ